MSARGRKSAGGVRAEARRQRRERILTAATELFAERGFAGTTMEEIAAGAGVSKGLPYDHFGSKESLLAAVWERQVGGWIEATSEGVKYTPGSLADAIGEVLRVSVRYARDNPLLRRILGQDPDSLVGGDASGIAAFGRFYRERLEPVLARGVRSGELRADLAISHTAELIWLLHFTLIREIFVEHADSPRGDADALLQATVALVVTGLRAR